MDNLTIILGYLYTPLLIFDKTITKSVKTKMIKTTLLTKRTKLIYPEHYTQQQELQILFQYTWNITQETSRLPKQYQQF